MKTTKANTTVHNTSTELISHMCPKLDGHGKERFNTGTHTLIVLKQKKKEHCASEVLKKEMKFDTTDINLTRQACVILVDA